LAKLLELELLFGGFPALKFPDGPLFWVANVSRMLFPALGAATEFQPTPLTPFNIVFWALGGWQALTPG